MGVAQEGMEVQEEAAVSQMCEKKIKQKQIRP